MKIAVFIARGVEHIQSMHTEARKMKPS